MQDIRSPSSSTQTIGPLRAQKSLCQTPPSSVRSSVKASPEDSADLWGLCERTASLVVVSDDNNVSSGSSATKMKLPLLDNMEENKINSVPLAVSARGIRQKPLQTECLLPLLPVMPNADSPDDITSSHKTDPDEAPFLPSISPRLFTFPSTVDDQRNDSPSQEGRCLSPPLADVQSTSTSCTDQPQFVLAPRCNGRGSSRRLWAPPPPASICWKSYMETAAAADASAVVVPITNTKRRRANSVTMSP